MSELPKPDYIDGVNYVRRTIPTATGPLEIEGLTVRSLRQILEKCDPDDCVVYLAEQTDETRDKDLLIGVIAGMGGGSQFGVTYLFGPEAVNAIAEAENGG